MQTAAFHRRLLANVYDALLIIALLIIGTQLFLLATEGQVIDPFVFQVYLFSLIFCFFVFFWWVLGQTPGMAAWRLQLVTQTGQPLRLARVLLRFLLGFLCGIVGWLWILWDKDRLPLYDRLCGTTLILKKEGASR